MPESSAGVNAWEQQSLLDPEVVEMRLRVGILTSVGHVQYQVEAWAPDQSNLLAMWSIPHGDCHEVDRDLARTIAELRRLVERYRPAF